MDVTTKISVVGGGGGEDGARSDLVISFDFSDTPTAKFGTV
jgi:hypothetical protein